ncbi:hypothetical protein ACN28S_53950 [Cystobacter fuscus]
METLEAVGEELTHLRQRLTGAEALVARRLETRLAQLGRALAADRRTLLQATSGLDEEVRRARTLPFAEGCAGLERNARDWRARRASRCGWRCMAERWSWIARSCKGCASRCCT